MRASKRHRWQRLQALAQAAEQQAAMALQAENQNAQLEVNRLKQLTDYSLDEAAQGNTIPALKFLRYRQFAAKLGDAVEQQTRTVQAARRRRAHARRDWLERRAAALQYEQLADTALREEHDEQERTERRQTDNDNLTRFASRNRT